MIDRMNLVFMGVFTYPKGMAATKRIQNVINSLKPIPGVTTRVILQRQSSELNRLNGMHDGIPYETVMGDLFRAKMALALPVLCIKTNAALKRAFRKGQKNIIYFYGPLFIENILPLRYAKKLGYKIVFDVIEDYGLTKEVSYSLYQRFRANIASMTSSFMKGLAAGGIAISSHLESSLRASTDGKLPVHYLPISVDLERFKGNSSRNESDISLFYAGSFGKKDGLPILLESFDRLAGNHGDLRLVLTGRGDGPAMRQFHDRLQGSPYRDRVHYKGYLDEQDYYDTLNSVDIPCMTRVDHAFAHAGFPFKLGEFLATGRPVIASRVSDVDNFLMDRHSALLVSPGSSDDICNAVEFIIDHPEKARTIGERGRAVAGRYFDYKAQGAALHAFLERI